MRVLQVSELPASPAAGGAGVYLASLLEGLAAAGVETECFAGEVVHEGARRVLDLWDPWARRLVRERVRSFRPDVVHVHNVLNELSVSVLGALEAPVVMTVHDFRLLGGTTADRQPLRSWVDRVVKQPVDRLVVRRHVDRYLAVSEPLARALAQQGFQPVEVVPHPVPAPRHPLLAPESSRTLVFAGRLVRDKGAELLAEAFAGVEDPTARLVIAGEGPELARLRARTDSRVELVGLRSSEEVSELLASCRAVVVPSLPDVRPEGSTLIGVEAARHGRPVVHSDDPAVAATMAPLGCGVQVPAGDAGALTRALAALLSDDALVARLGAAGLRTSSERHDLAAVTDQCVRAYASVLGRRR